MGQTITIPARYDQVAPLCDFVVDAAVAAGLDADAAFQVQLACDEACTNIIEHAYGGQGGEIEVTWPSVSLLDLLSRSPTVMTFQEKER